MSTPNRTEAQLRAYYGKHPPEGQRCTDNECVQCETRDLFDIIDRLRKHLGAVCYAYGQVTAVRNLLEPVCEADEQDLAKLNAEVAEALAVSREGEW